MRRFCRTELFAACAVILGAILALKFCAPYSAPVSGRCVLITSQNEPVMESLCASFWLDIDCSVGARGATWRIYLPENAKPRRISVQPRTAGIADVRYIVGERLILVTLDTSKAPEPVSEGLAYLVDLKVKF